MQISPTVNQLHSMYYYDIISFNIVNISSTVSFPKFINSNLCVIINLLFIICSSSMQIQGRLGMNNQVFG